MQTSSRFPTPQQYQWPGLLLFKLIWLALVLGQERWLLPVMLVLLPMQLWCLYRSARPKAWATVLAVALIGISVDQCLSWLDVFQFGQRLLPAWLALLWLSFALALAQLKSCIAHWSWWALSLLGASGGMLSYYAGFVAGAVDFGLTVPIVLLTVGAVWALLLPLFLKLLTTSLAGAQTLSVMLLAVISIDSPRLRAEVQDNWRVVGAGDFRFLMFPIYSATLEAQSAEFHFPQSLPLRLTLKYARPITPLQITEATREQWQHQQLAFDEAWLSRLQQCLPTIAKGDRLSFQIEREDLAELQFNGEVRCTFQDREFIRSFIAIWLGERTSAPALRLALLGEKS